MKIFSNEHVFKHPWDRISLANWAKYPNDHTPHVIHVDYLSRRVDPTTGILHTERLLTCRQHVPAFLRKLFGGEDVSLFYERSEVDPEGRTLILRSRNLTYCNLLVVEEKCTYQQHAEHAESTLFRQEASIKSVAGWAHIRSTIEEFCASRFLANANKGRLALEYAVERLYAETKEQVLETFGRFESAPSASPNDPRLDI